VAQPDWAVYLSNVLTGLAGKISSVVGSWAKTTAYGDSDRSPILEALAGKISAGIPGAETVSIGDTEADVIAADVVNASRLAAHRDATSPVNRLTIKALDTLDFLQHWTASGGDTGGDSADTPVSDLPGALTAAEITDRIRRSDDRRLVVTPNMPGSIKGASVDLRIGNRFIVFERSTAAAFDALDPRQDPRSMQLAVERAWGDVLYLHPGQLVLASTLEYICLPGDLTAQVITRSSYGRLGLISATAVQVHPHFSGCLTLELVNLGEIPMAITPGERIAQLMLFTTTSVVAAPHVDDDKYRYPTGPEFSKVRDDSETRVLRNMRTSFDLKVGRQSL
jgi:deoxycytidine triphosphate deaminase